MLVALQNNEQAKQYVHLLNSTLTATERTICCILENNQKENGVEIPVPLQPFMGTSFLPFQNSPALEVKGKKSKAKVYSNLFVYLQISCCTTIHAFINGIHPCACIVIRDRSLISFFTWIGNYHYGLGEPRSMVGRRLLQEDISHKWRVRGIEKHDGHFDMKIIYKRRLHLLVELVLPFLFGKLFLNHGAA